MDLTTAAADGVQAMVDTVEVVSTSEQVIDQQEDAPRVNISVVNSHNAASLPSTGVPIEIDPQALSLAISQQSQLVTSGLVAASRVTPALVAEVPSSQAGLLTSGSTMVDIGMKRNYEMSHLDGSDIADEGSAYQDLPRKKSRNYLDSHKTIEKKRRDRINTSLQQLKQLIPDCRHYGGKKLDKAEILEMTIEYVQQMNDQSSRPSTAELLSSQREWVNELMTWIFQNRVLYTGPNSLDQFCSALLLHLQSFSPSTSLLPSVASHVHQAVGGSGGTGGGSSTSGSEDESALRSQATTTNLSLALLQHLTGAQQAPLKEGVSIPTSSSPLQQQQAQLAQLQALLLQQQLLQQQQQGAGNTSSGNGESVGEGGGGNGPEVSTEQLQQLQQLHQLQTLLIQHLASETSSNPSSVDVKQETASGASNGTSQVQDTGNSASGNVMVGSSDPAILSTVTDTSCISTQTNTTGSGGEISLSTSAIQASGPTTSIYSSSLSSGLDADNLLRSMGDGGGQAVWSEEQPQGELLMLSSARDEGTAPTMVHEEVTFLTHQQQQH